MTTYICSLYYPPQLLSTVVFGTKPPTTTVGDTQDPSHSVLLPSEPIKRPSQHSVAIQATPTLFVFRRGKGSTGGGGGRVTRNAEEHVQLYSHTTSIRPTPPHTPHPHTCTPPLSRSLTVRSTSTPFSCKKS